jgi:Mn-dependent DtxR family transcriptional regulator
MEEEYGYIFLDDDDLAEAINISKRTLKKYNKTLIELGYLEIVEVDGEKVRRLNLKKLNGK